MLRVTPKRPQTKHPMFRNRRHNEKLREKTLQRDNYTCSVCFEPYPEYKLHSDHIVPLQQGGVDNISNTQCICIPCHKIKTLRENQQLQLKAAPNE